MVAEAGASECTTCPVGQEVSSSNQYCEPCAIGSWGTTENDVAICKICTSPFTSLEEGQTTCSHCAKNYYRAPCSATSRIKDDHKYIGFGVFEDVKNAAGISTSEWEFRDANQAGQRLVLGCDGSGGLMDGHDTVDTSYACLPCQGETPLLDDDGDRLGRSKRQGMKCAEEDAEAGMTIESLELFGGGDLGINDFDVEIPGYWRFSPHSNDVYQCDVAPACVGGVPNVTELTGSDGTIVARDYEWWTEVVPPSWQKDKYAEYKSWQLLQCGVGYVGPICR